MSAVSMEWLLAQIKLTWKLILIPRDACMQRCILQQLVGIADVSQVSDTERPQHQCFTKLARSRSSMHRPRGTTVVLGTRRATCVALTICIYRDLCICICTLYIYIYMYYIYIYRDLCIRIYIYTYLFDTYTYIVFISIRIYIYILYTYIQYTSDVCQT